MKKFLIALMVALSGASLTISEAEAKRLGGGGSFGKQSPTFSRQAPTQGTQNQATNTNQAKPAQTPSTSPWRGILGGALLGLGLGALLSHLGIGGALASMISTILMIALLALAAMFIYRMFRRKSTEAGPRPAYAGGFSPGSMSDTETRIEPHARPAALQADGAVMTGTAGTALSVPADFDVQSFLRNAKTYFIRLQDAWDRGNANDIREFTTPEMFGELRLQLQERGAAANHTDVVSLDAELLGVEKAGDEYVASVKFNGLIRESENAQPEPFTEVWNLSKPVAGEGGWVLAGIQQLS